MRALLTSLRRGQLMSHRKACLIAVLALVFSVCQQCGYSTRSLVRSDIHSVYVPVFGNETFRRGFEKDLTSALVGEIKRHSSMDIMPAEQADSILRGRIVDMEERVVTKTEADRIVHKRVKVTVKFHWKDRRTGTDIIPPQTISRTGRFVPGLGENKFQSAIEDVAQAIVEKTWQSW